MAKFPAMPLWTDAYLADCGHLDDAETGRYLMILIHLWRAPNQRFPNDDSWLARKFRRSVEDVQSQLRPLIIEFCRCSGNWISQDRLSREFVYISEQSEKQSRRGSMRWDSDRQRVNAQKRSQRMTEAREKGTHTKEEWEILKQIFGCCVLCGTTDYNLEKDHIMPIYQGGSDAIENIQPSCAKCNASKGPECQDKRSAKRSDWVGVFEDSVCRKLLINNDGNVCLDGRHSTPTPTPTYRSKRKREGKPSPKKGFRLSEDWTLPKLWGEWAVQQKLSEKQIREQAERFRDYWIGVPGQKGVKLDWQATWRNWIRSAIARGTGYVNGGPSRSQPTASDGIRAELRAQDEAKAAGVGR